MELVAILSGLAAAVAWGTADFAGGLASRGVSAVRVVLASQFLGTLALLALNLALRQAIPAPHDLLLGMIAGLAGGTGLVLLYLSLARDKMGVAAPLTAVLPPLPEPVEFPEEEWAPVAPPVAPPVGLPEDDDAV